MVWKESGKYGIHTGRTLRKSSERISNRERGFLIKTVANTDINFTDEDVKRCLKKFQVQDGFNNEDVAKHSRSTRHWGFGGRGGFSDNSVLFSIGKRKRWLVPTILREKIPDDFDSENDYKVVLVERVSVNGSSWYCRSPRLQHGDCTAVLDGADLRKPKRRKFAHVGDLRKESNKPEIFYEVNHTESLTSWPSYLQHDWRESRDGTKAKCKKKGKKNKRRLWGDHRKSELGKEVSGNQEKGLFDHDVKCGVGKEKLLVLSADNFEHCSSPVPDENDFPDFDIGSYICQTLTRPGLKNAKKHVKVTGNDDMSLTTVNPASSQRVNLHGKGLAVYIDPVASQNDYHDNNDNTDFAASTVTAPLTTENVPSKTVSVDVDIESEKLNSRELYEQFGETYKEGASLPRRFSICPTNQSSKFVFTCQPQPAQDADNGTQRVAVTVVSDVLPSKKFQNCKEFLCNSFDIDEQKSRIEEEPAADAVPDCNPVSSSKCSQRVAVMPFDLLCDVNRWSYKTSLPSLAVPDALPSKTHRTEAVCSGEPKAAILPDAIMCEICFCEVYHDSSDGKKDFKIYILKILYF